MKAASERFKFISHPYWNKRLRQGYAKIHNEYSLIVFTHSHEKSKSRIFFSYAKMAAKAVNWPWNFIVLELVVFHTHRHEALYKTD